MSDRFFLYFAVTLWLLMVIGFSDNWLFDTAQESNSQPRFLVHSFFAAAWFTLLVVQALLVRSRAVQQHMKLGVIAILAYVGMTITIWYLFAERYIATGDLMIFFKPVEILSVVLIVLGVANRKKDRIKHRQYMMFASFCLVGPALDRSVFHIFGPEHMIVPMLLLYLGLFAWFGLAIKKIIWYMVLWFVFMAYNLYPMVSRAF